MRRAVRVFCFAALAIIVSVPQTALAQAATDGEPTSPVTKLDTPSSNPVKP